jgi:prepilin peptidase CpaA
MRERFFYGLAFKVRAAGAQAGPASGVEWMILALFSLIFFALCLAGAFSDVRSMTIPNQLNLAIAGLFLPAAGAAYFFAGIEPVILGGHLMTGMIAFIVCFALFSFGVVGGGDAKMIPAVMLWMGTEASLPFVYFTALAGGGCALLILVISKFVPIAILPGALRAPFEAKNGKPYVPYGVAIAAGAILASPHSLLFGPFMNQTGFGG